MKQNNICTPIQAIIAGWKRDKQRNQELSEARQWLEKVLESSKPTGDVKC